MWILSIVEALETVGVNLHFREVRNSRTLCIIWGMGAGPARKMTSFVLTRLLRISRLLTGDLENDGEIHT